jgi:hypothetical protein
MLRAADACTDADGAHVKPSAEVRTFSIFSEPVKAGTNGGSAPKVPRARRCGYSVSETTQLTSLFNEGHLYTYHDRAAAAVRISAIGGVDTTEKQVLKWAKNYALQNPTSGPARKKWK